MYRSFLKYMAILSIDISERPRALVTKSDDSENYSITHRSKFVHIHKASEMFCFWFCLFFIYLFLLANERTLYLFMLRIAVNSGWQLMSGKMSKGQKLTNIVCTEHLCQNPNQSSNVQFLMADWSSTVNLYFRPAILFNPFGILFSTSSQPHLSLVFTKL